MSVFSNIGQSIFIRIYAGLVIICFLVALLGYVMYSGISEYRFKQYREAMATGAFYLVAAGVARQQEESAKQDWLADASSLFAANFKILDPNGLNLTDEEKLRLAAYEAVVRYYEKGSYAEIYQKIPNDENLVGVRLQKVTEQQVKAIGVFLMDDLAYFPGKEKARLKELQRYFNYPISWKKLDEVELDLDQIARIRRKEIVLLLRDSTNAEKSAISVVIPNPQHDEVIVMGPINLFNAAPLNIIVALTAISLLLISLGVYALIFPLERKLRFIQKGVSQVRAGKLDTKVKVIGHDEVAHLATTFNNMTEHIKRLIDTQREMTRAVSHELRTPVARIRFAVDMLADTDEQASRFEQLETIDKDIEALDGLIDEILTYAKLEEGSPKLEIEKIKLKEIVAQVVNETNALGRAAEVMAVDIPEKLVVLADRRYLHRVLQNLAGNATRYANSKIVISAGIEKNTAFIAVEDDGPGIPEKDREKVFLPFARLDDSRTRASGGYGLGLSIVSRIAFWFNGTMKVDKSPQLGGARFSMRWPVKPIDIKVKNSNDNLHI